MAKAKNGTKVAKAAGKEKAAAGAKGGKVVALQGVKDRRANFARLANIRCKNAVKAIQLIGNLSNTNDYDFTDADVAEIMTAIRTELAAAEARFQVSKLRATRKPVQIAA